MRGEEKRGGNVFDWVVRHPIWAFAALTTVAIIIVIAYSRCLPRIISCLGEWTPVVGDPNGYKGLFGDSFGALTSFFSILAMMAVLLTFLCQKKQLDVQKAQLQNEKELQKYQQVPLLELGNPILVIHNPCSDGDVDYSPKLEPIAFIKSGNGFLVREAKVEVCLLHSDERGNGKRSIVHSCFAGIGDSEKHKINAQFEISDGEFSFFCCKAREAIMCHNDRPIMVTVDVVYTSLLGLSIHLHREYGLGAPEGNAIEQAQDWNSQLEAKRRGLSVKGGQHTLYPIPRKLTVQFSLAEFSERASFKILK